MQINVERRLFRVGEDSFAVTLPKAWVRRYSLNRGDIVQVIANDDIIVRPGHRDKQSLGCKELTVSNKSISPIKVCRFCGKKFEPVKIWQKYCSRQCRLEAYRKGRPRERLRFSIFARDGFRCRYCGRSPQEDEVKLVIDHVIPVSKGGTDEPGNLITSCAECNRGKGNLTYRLVNS